LDYLSEFQVREVRASGCFWFHDECCPINRYVINLEIGNLLDILYPAWDATFGLYFLFGLIEVCGNEL